MGAQSSIELQWLDYMTGYQGSSPSDDHQGDMPYYVAMDLTPHPSTPTKYIDANVDWK